MPKKIIFILISFLLILFTPPPVKPHSLERGAGFTAYTYASSLSPESSKFSALTPFNKSDRILILAPHPDDEAIACAGVIQQAIKAKADIRVGYLTNGDHNQLAFIVYEKRITFRKGEFIHMGEVRRQEAIKAMRALGLTEKELVFLGYPDFGTFAIFSRYWRQTKPYRSLLTRISSVPYKQNLSFGAPYKGESILNDLKNVLLKYKPTKIFVSHPLDVNVDHKALYLFLQVTLADLEKELSKPQVYPYLVHCLGWPLPRRYHPQLTLEPPEKFLDSSVKWLRLILTPEQLDKKNKDILCYKSQTQSSAFYLLTFARKNELFGDFPEVDINKEASSKEKPLSLFNFSHKSNSSIFSESTNSEKSTEDEGQLSYGLADSSLLIHIEKTKNLDRRFSILLYLFGYSYKTPFAQMPKISIFTRRERLKIFDGRKIIKPDGIRLDLNSKEFNLKIPLKILGEPDFILASLKAHGETLPADVIGFRKIKLK